MSRNRTIQKALVQIATIGPVGRLPIAPGTWCSALAVIIWWLFLSSLAAIEFWLVIVVVIIFAVWVSDRAERTLGKDARSIVIDELVGQWIPLAICPKRIILVLLAFFLFRLFDIWKPFPVEQSQSIKGGFGVVIDDVLAGGYSLLILIIIQRIWIG